MKIKIFLTSIFCLGFVASIQSMNERPKLLLEKFYGYDKKPIDLLFDGVNENKTDLITKAIQQKADINAEDHYGNTPLIVATCSLNTNIVKFLLDIGANPNIQKQKNGFTALMYAVITKHENIIKILLDNEALLDLVNKAGQTALDIAKERGMI